VNSKLLGSGVMSGQWPGMIRRVEGKLALMDAAAAKSALSLL